MFGPLRQLFDYQDSSGAAAPGDLIEVPFGRRNSQAIVIERVSVAAVSRLKSVLRIIQPGRVALHQLLLLKWCWRYYQHPPGEVLAAAIPSLLRSDQPYQPNPELEYYLTASGRRQSEQSFARAPSQLALWQLLSQSPQRREHLHSLLNGWPAAFKRLQHKGWAAAREITIREQSGVAEARPVQLNQEQQAAVKQLRGHLRHYQCCLLDGVTGSGKTEVYIELIRELLSAQRQALVLVPEIGLVTQLVQRLQQQLGTPVNTFHSGMSDAQRARTWLAAQNGQAELVVGTRSAVFLPFAALGMLIVDEEHDPGYKQFEGFHYSARDVAIKRARMLDVPVLLGSATPSLESLENVQRQRYALLRLTQRHAQGALPEWQLVDCRSTAASRQTHASGSSYGLLHPDSIAAMHAQLDAGQQVLVFQNRRGYAPLLQCPACGWQADCPRCSAHMTWHRGAGRLHCHHCEWQQRQPRHCPACAAPELEHFGSGTEQLEQLLAENFSNFPVHRVDSDSMRNRQAMQRLRREVLNGQPCILVGTQMLTKGHHFPNITLVITVDVDQALFSADFRATERLAQQLVQVAGRAGRGRQAGRILLQTRQPEDPLLRLLISADYAQVAARLLSLRQQAGFPPYAAQVILRAEAVQASAVEQFLRRARQAGLRLELPGELLGPIPALLEKRAGRYRYQLWWQAERREQLQQALPGWVDALQDIRQAGGVRWHIDVDPVAL